MISERFIQDAIFEPHRLQRIVNDAGFNWQFCDNDVMNQEFSFSKGKEGGRIDVISTFENRTKLILAEIKCGKVGDWELQQLKWYVENWQAEDVKIVDESLKEVNEVAGLLVAQDFFPFKQTLNEEAKRLKINFVSFQFNAMEFPFKVVDPGSIKLEEDNDDPASVLRHSSLYTEDDWTKKCSERLLHEFCRWKNCLLDDNDPRLQWVSRIYKSGHIAIHYKGEYIIWLHPRTRADRLDGGYGFEGPNTNITWEHDSDVAKPHVEKILQRIDAKYAEVIPNGFEWPQV